jgi:hypothetical protein
MLAQLVSRTSLDSLNGLFGKYSGILKISRRIELPGLKSGGNPSFWELNYYDGGGNYLTDTVLPTTDRASMFHGLEARSVFTDHRIIEYMSRVPESIILKGGKDKYLLRRLLAGYLPGDYAFRRRKKGFSVPLTTDYGLAWKRSVDEAVTMLPLVDIGPLDKKFVRRILLQDGPSGPFELKTRFVFLLYYLKGIVS